MNLRITALAFPLALAACGTINTSSGPLPVGPDTWRIIAKNGVNGAGASQGMALKEANAHCTSLGKQILLTGSRELDSAGVPSFEVTFRCLNAGDRDLTRPDLVPAPSTVIQVR